MSRGEKKNETVAFYPTFLAQEINNDAGKLMIKMKINTVTEIELSAFNTANAT